MTTLRTTTTSTSTSTSTTSTSTTAAPTPMAATSAAGTFSAADEAFFRITASLFAPAFLFGAGVLLASYDDEDETPEGTHGTREHGATGTAPATTSVPA